MAAFTRIALVVLSGMAGRVLRQRKTAPTAAATPPTAHPDPDPTTNAQTAPPTIPMEVAGPSDPFRNLTYRRAPRLASVAARSLPIVGILSTLVTLVIAIGAVLGELPGVGLIEDTNLAWATALVTISIWAIYLLWRVPQWQANAWARNADATPRELFQIENESRGTLGQILSGVAVLTGLIFAWQQLGQTSDNLRVSEEGQITDRFSRAVDQLGSDHYTIRLGGIYALERIARDSPRDYGPVMEVLTAFARQESPVVGDAGTPAVAAPEVPGEVAAVFKVLGRRSETQIQTEMAEGRCLDLTGINAVGADLAGFDLRNTCWDRSDLRGAVISRANLSDAYFGAANLQQANLDRVTAERASFNSANLIFANLSQGNFTGANFLDANLTSAILQGTDLDDASLLQANLQFATAIGASLNGANLLLANVSDTVFADADLSGAKELTAEQATAAFTNANTRLPPGLEVEPDA
ncbi:MAG: pentapeptide repeat-containing protein [Thermomicrobiales bacterium]|nr:pentapeptide repeat-containing protein [Thermomicrobiales bacterium]